MFQLRPTGLRAQRFVTSRFKNARLIRINGQFRVLLGWRYEPRFPFIDDPNAAWKTARTFLKEYPRSPHLHPSDKGHHAPCRTAS